MRGSGPEQEVRNAQESVFTGADHSGSVTGGISPKGQGRDPGARDLGADVLPLEVQVRGGMIVSEAKCLKHLESENRRLNKLVADLSLDKQMLQEVVDRKW